MRIFLYEALTGGPLIHGGIVSGTKSMRAEGLAMLRALAADLAALPDVWVDCLVDCRDDRRAGAGLLGPRAWGSRCTLHHAESAAARGTRFDSLAAAAHWTLAIAPETAGELLELRRRIDGARGRALLPSAAFIALAGDKHRTASALRESGIPAPEGAAVTDDFDFGAFTYPAVVKPRDGCGSAGVRRAVDARAARRAARGSSTGYRIERFCPGRAASAAFLCGPERLVPLPPCWQRLSADGHFAYLGGETPIDEEFARRATALAESAVRTALELSQADCQAGDCNATLGYVGVDLVLGRDDSGADDYVIEINPRCTTSYLGLRSLAKCDLAGAMLQIAAGEEAALSFQKGPVQFGADEGGSIRRDSLDLG